MRGLKSGSMVKAIQYDKEAGLTEREICDKYDLGVLDVLAGKKSIQFVAGRLEFVAIGSPEAARGA